MHFIFNNLFYIAYISMIVLYGSLSPSQLTSSAKKSFRLFGLLILIVISLDMTSFILGFKYHFLKDFLLYAQVICMFIILFQLKKSSLNKINIYSYLFTLICLSIYTVYSLTQLWGFITTVIL
ncbi:hypothetical protein BCR22_02300 [Enterococcus plantarum]|uniref:Uncharacterized protein n=1 Tax=Enterococcus plantarum TaxID=1077675 RepID=A0A2W3Z6C2_9ENTE|nr:hypothetical protein [Enterococcus plantarum]MBO0421764.1 hypothetical protein [Enterococcus plantarum]MBO0466131.1 hypothetical protein [Enterococcus plantarum]OEG17509.1 hypothetical protein BCR22_02300 [Enterococcus plantarum]PZL72820.1 hypothetical protein CI088_10010 [Enterococcus plantarum]